MSTITARISAREAVHNGAQQLDRTHPDWWKTLDLPNLNMAWTYACVLGQTVKRAGDLEDDVDVEEAYDHYLTEHGIDPVEHGFDSPDDARWMYADLHREWVALVEKRRAAA